MAGSEPVSPFGVLCERRDTHLRYHLACYLTYSFMLLPHDKCRRLCQNPGGNPHGFWKKGRDHVIQPLSVGVSKCCREGKSPSLPPGGRHITKNRPERRRGHFWKMASWRSKKVSTVTQDVSNMIWSDLDTRWHCRSCSLALQPKLRAATYFWSIEVDRWRSSTRQEKESVPTIRARASCVSRPSVSPYFP